MKYPTGLILSHRLFYLEQLWCCINLRQYWSICLVLCHLKPSCSQKTSLAMMVFLYTQAVIVRILGLLVLLCFCGDVSSLTFLSLSSLSNLYVLGWVLYLLRWVELCVVVISLSLKTSPTYFFLFFSSRSPRTMVSFQIPLWCKAKLRHLLAITLHGFISLIFRSIRPGNSQTLAGQQRLWHPLL